MKNNQYNSFIISFTLKLFIDMHEFITLYLNYTLIYTVVASKKIMIRMLIVEYITFKRSRKRDKDHQINVIIKHVLYVITRKCQF